MGMRTLEMGTFNRRHMRFTAGRKRAAAPMFCMKLEITATVPETRVVILRGLFPERRTM